MSRRASASRHSPSRSILTMEPAIWSAQTLPLRRLWRATAAGRPPRCPRAVKSTPRQDRHTLPIRAPRTTPARAAPATTRCCATGRPGQTRQKREADQIPPPSVYSRVIPAALMSGSARCSVVRVLKVRASGQISALRLNALCGGARNSLGSKSPKLLGTGSRESQ